jgi:cobalt-zinc-cadmium efflux system outer membrane protein
MSSSGKPHGKEVFWMKACALFRRGSFLLLAMTAVAAGGQTQTPVTAPITLERAVEMARSKNPTLLAAREHMLAIHSNEITAGLRQNPDLSLTGADVTLGANNPASPYAYAANVSRLFERGQKRHWRLESTRGYSAAADEQYNDQVRQILFQVRQNFVQVLQAKAVLDLAQQDLDSWRQTLSLSKSRLDAGDMSGTDYTRLDLQFAQFETDYENAVQDLQQNSVQLQALLGIEHPSLTFDVVGDLAPPVFTKTLSELEQSALAHRPDLLAAQHTAEATAADHQLAISNGTTDPTLAAEYERVATYNSVGFSISIPLRIFDRNQGEKQRTAFEASSSQFSVVASRIQVISDVDQAWAAYESASHLAERYNNHYLGEAKEVRDNLEFGFQHGSTTLLDFLDAERDYRQTRLNGVNANAQVWLAISQLDETTAMELVP